MPIQLRYLHSTGHTYGRPIQGQHEISGHGNPGENNLWKAMVSSSCVIYNKCLY